MSCELRNLMEVLWDKNLSCFSSSCITWSYKRYNPFPVGLTVLGYNRLLRMEIGQKGVVQQQTRKKKKLQEGKTMAQTNWNSLHKTAWQSWGWSLQTQHHDRILHQDYWPLDQNTGIWFLERVPRGVANGHAVSCLQEAGRKLDIAQMVFCASRRSKDMQALKEGFTMHICGRLCCSMGGGPRHHKLRSRWGTRFLLLDLYCQGLLPGFPAPAFGVIVWGNEVLHMIWGHQQGCA